MNLMNLKSGLISVEDVRDEQYKVANVVSERTFRYWHVPKIFNQGSTNMCVAYAWLGFFADSPMPQTPIPIYSPRKLYNLALKLDDYPGEADAGTSIRGGIKAAIQLGQKIEYRWAKTIDEIINTVLEVGPMVVGTVWQKSMLKPIKGRLVVNHDWRTRWGAHAYVLSGVDVNEGIFRLQNSWGTSWGNKGQAIIDIDDFVKLNKYGYEACIALEI